MSLKEMKKIELAMIILHSYTISLIDYLVINIKLIKLKKNN